MTRLEMLAAKIPFCIYCGKPGTPGATERTGQLHHGNMVGPGPGHAPSDFPGDPTGTKYFGAGAGAYVYFHLGCTPKTAEALRKNEVFIADYNALIVKHGKKIASCGCCDIFVNDAEGEQYRVDANGSLDEVKL